MKGVHVQGLVFTNARQMRFAGGTKGLSMPKKQTPKPFTVESAERILHGYPEGHKEREKIERQIEQYNNKQFKKEWGE